jgi:hypothetical protein
MTCGEGKCPMNDAALKPPGLPRIVEIPLGRKPLCRLTYSEEDVRVSDEVRDWVGFMSVENEDGEAVYCGTVFVCLVYGSDRSRTFMYLVTAKHNVLGVGERDCNVWLNLMNDKEEPSMDCEPITITAGTKWYYHPTESHRTDVAVLPIPFLWQLRMPRPVIHSFAVTDDDFKDQRVGCGDEGFMVGLFKGYEGAAWNVPVVRRTTIAATDFFGKPLKIMSPEFCETEPIDAYLIEVRSIGGFSGSPVFTLAARDHGTKVTAEKDKRIGTYLLLGIMHGHTNVHAKDASLQDDVFNSGIAIVTPAQKIVETVDQPELVEMRKKIEKSLSKKSVTLDFDDSGTKKEDAPPMTPEELIRRAVNTPPMKKAKKKARGKK